MSVQRHPVADLLTDEMRERVRAATFVHHKIRGKRAEITAKVGNRWCCPIGVAIGVPGCPASYISAERLGIEPDDVRIYQIERFTELVDMGVIDPADVYVMLGCEPTDGAS